MLFSDVGGRCLPFVMKGLCGDAVMSGPNSPQRRLSMSYHWGPFCLRWSMPMVEWLVVVQSDASSSCPIVRTEASHMVAGNKPLWKLVGSRARGAAPSREQGGQKRSMSAQMRVAIPAAHTRAAREPRRCSISQMPAVEARVQAVVGGPIGIEAHINGTDASWSG